MDDYENIVSTPFMNAAGEVTSLSQLDGRAFLVVNVASKCGLAPQYEQLETVQQQWGDRNLLVVGFPCNQFLGQEPGSMETILEYCSTTWGVSFPIMDKIKVNGPGTAPLYRALKSAPNVEKKRGPIRWNFEKFLLIPGGELHRFSPQTQPLDERITAVLDTL